MFGKWFASAYTGSMYGAGAHVFAVWAWVIANAGASGVVEINPRQLADTIGEPIEKIVSALEYLTAPDPDSRSEEEQGRRLVHEGAFQYRIANHRRYRELRNEEARREQNRTAKAKQRARDRDIPAADNVDGQQSQPKQKAEGRRQRSDPEAEGKRARTPVAQSEPDLTDPTCRAIVEALMDDLVLREAIANPRQLAERITGRLQASAKPLSWALKAIERAADQIAAAKASGDVMPPARAATLVMQWATNPKPPPDDAQQSEHEHEERKAADRKQYERPPEPEPEGPRMPPQQISGLAQGVLDGMRPKPTPEDTTR